MSAPSKESLKLLKATTAKLNVAADKATATLEEMNTWLKTNGPCIPYALDVFDEDWTDREWLTHSLEYGRTPSGTWGLMIRQTQWRRNPVFDEDHQETGDFLDPFIFHSKVVSISAASRIVRIKAAGKLSNFIDGLVEEAENISKIIVSDNKRKGGA